MADKRIELARTLIALTEEGKIDWEILSSDDKVVANLGSGRVVVSLEPYQSSIDVVVRVYNSLGNVAEEFTDVTLKELSDGSEGWFTKLSEMIKLARRQALGSDELLDDIIRELKGGAL